jgi:hypothetical protein
MVELQTRLTGLAFGESPRWHDGGLWLADWGSQEVLAVDLDGNSQVILRVPTARPQARLTVAGPAPGDSGLADRPAGSRCNPPQALAPPEAGSGRQHRSSHPQPIPPRRPLPCRDDPGEARLRWLVAIEDATATRVRGHDDDAEDH